MNGHLTSPMMERLQRRELEPEEVLNVMRHLSSCAECRSRHGGGKESIALVLPREQTHLDPDAQMFPFVDGTADAATREVVESHLEDCAMCRAEVEDLRTFVRTSRSRPRRRLAYGALATAAAAALVYAGAIVLQEESSVAPPRPRPVQVVRNDPPPAPAPAPLYANARWVALVEDAVERKALPQSPHIRELRPPADELRGATAAGGAELAPAGVVVDAVRPLFTWDARPGSTYVVYVFHEGQEAVRSEPLQAARWRPVRALARGRTYAWQVEETAGEESRLLPSPPAPPAMFRILGTNEHAELEEAVKRHPDDHLLHAVLYAAFGMDDEADAKLRRAVDAGDRRARTIASRSGH